MTGSTSSWRAKDRTSSDDSPDRRRLLDGVTDEEKYIDSFSESDSSLSLSQKLLALFRRRVQGWSPIRSTRRRMRSPTRRSMRITWLRRILIFIASLPMVVAFLIIMVGVFFPSYTHEPAQYKALRKRIGASDKPGRANINNEKIFVVSSIYDNQGELVSGAWGDALLSLVDLLGPDNVFLSIYENDADDKAQEQLDRYQSRVACTWPPTLLQGLY